MNGNLGTQAMRMAATFSAGQNAIANREQYALRTQEHIEEKQKETLTNVWAEELGKNPNAKMPDKLPHGVKFAAKVLAMKAQTDFVSLDRQRFAKEAETYKQDLDTGLASLMSGKREYYEVPVLRAMSRIRDGRSDYKKLDNGKWEYTNNSTGKREQVDEPNAEWLHNYLSAHSDIQPYLAAKIKETNYIRDHNAEVMKKNGVEWLGNDGVSRGTIFKGYAVDKGSYKDLYVATGPDGIERELKTPEEIKWFHKNFRNVDEAKGRATIAESDKKIRESAIPTASKNVTIGNDTISKSDAFKTISMLSSQLFEKGSKAADVATMAVSALASGVKLSMADFKSGGANSPYAQALEKSKLNDAMGQKAKQYLAYIDAVTGGGGGSTSTQNKSWRDYKD